MSLDTMTNVPVIPNIDDSFDVPEGIELDFSVPEEIKLDCSNIPKEISIKFTEKEGKWQYR